MEQEEFSKKQLRRQEKFAEKETHHRNRAIKTFFKQAALIVLVGGAIAGLWWLIAKIPKQASSAIISTRGIHWHPYLSIRIHGEEITIPANIGLAGRHNPMHTHETDGIIHLEYSGAVSEDNIRLKNFFEIWGRSFNRECILDSCNGEKGTMRMMVNGEPNNEFGDYMMRDEDRIEIIFE